MTNVKATCCGGAFSEEYRGHYRAFAFTGNSCGFDGFRPVLRSFSQLPTTLVVGSRQPHSGTSSLPIRAIAWDSGPYSLLGASTNWFVFGNDRTGTGGRYCCIEVGFRMGCLLRRPGNREEPPAYTAAAKIPGRTPLTLDALQASIIVGMVKRAGAELEKVRLRNDERMRRFREV